MTCLGQEREREEDADREEKRVRRDRHKIEKHAKEREGREQIGIKSQPRKGKRKTRNEEMWTSALRNDGLLISEAPIQRIGVEKKKNNNNKNLELGQPCYFLRKQYKYTY